MIAAKKSLVGVMPKKESITGKVGVGIKTIYPPLIDLEVTPTKEIQTFKHEDSYGYDNVIIDPIPDEYIIPDGTLEVAQNGDVDVTNFKMARVGVYTPPNLQDKAIEINENGTHLIKADEEYDGLSQVEITVDAIEDLTNEITTYNNELSEQETTIEDILEAMKNKGIGEAPKYTPQYISFYGYDGKNLDYELANLDTSNVSSMTRMFYGCSNLTTLDLRTFNTSKTRSMDNMFYGCSKITSLDLSSFDTSAVSNMSSMFYSCRVLTQIDMRGFTFDTVTSYSNMFTGVPIDCLIIVKDDVAKEWVLAKRNTFTNVKTVAELEVA